MTKLMAACEQREKPNKNEVRSKIYSSLFQYQIISHIHNHESPFFLLTGLVATFTYIFDRKKLCVYLGPHHKICLLGQYCNFSGEDRLET